jgi:uncharacterized membrane protein
MEIQTTRESPDASTLAKSLGWFSVGLGVAELAAPRTLARMIGVDETGPTPLTLRAMGVRELVSGIGILARPRRAGPLWARVVGDAIDLGLLTWALRSHRTSAQRLGIAIGSVAGVMVLDVIAGMRQRRSLRARPIIRTITINRSPTDVYAHWRNLEDLPRFTSYLESVTELDDERSRWVAKLPTGNTVEWTAELLEDVPGERIRWRATSGPDLRGTVLFRPAPGGRGTEVRIAMQVGSGGRVGSSLAKLIVGSQIEGDLRRFKQVLETGDLVRSDASIHRMPHPAQPDQEGV